MVFVCLIFSLACSQAKCHQALGLADFVVSAVGGKLRHGEGKRAQTPTEGKGTLCLGHPAWGALGKAFPVVVVSWLVAPGLGGRAKGGG